MKRTPLLILVFALIALITSGCLNIEKKHYTVHLRDNGGGTATVKYINIVSSKEDDKDVSMKDFATLITDWMKGDKLDDEFADAEVTDKKLYVENDMLIAEVKLEFDSLSALGLYQYNEESPYMRLFCSDFATAQFLESNGDYGGEDFPVAFWSNDARILKWTEKHMDDMSDAVSLVDEYKKWKKDQE
jgi:hypothetical protein